MKKILLVLAILSSFTLIINIEKVYSQSANSKRSSANLRGEQILLTPKTAHQSSTDHEPVYNNIPKKRIQIYNHTPHKIAIRIRPNKANTENQYMIGDKIQPKIIGPGSFDFAFFDLDVEELAITIFYAAKVLSSVSEESYLKDYPTLIKFMLKVPGKSLHHSITASYDQNGDLIIQHDQA